MRVAAPIVHDILTATALAGTPAAEVLLRAGTTSARLAGPWVAGEIAIAIWAAALHLTGDKTLGIRTGQLPNLGVLGPIGFRLLAAPNLATAFADITRYAGLMGDMMTYQHATTNDGRFVFRAKPHPNWLASHALSASVAVEATLSTAHTLAGLLLGQPVMPQRLQLVSPIASASAWPELGITMTQGPANELSWQVALFAKPLPSADAAAYRNAGLRCDDLLAQLRQPAASKDQLVAWLQIWDWLQGAPQLADAATALGHSTRSLQRQLAGQNTSWQTLLQQCRLQQALVMLGETTLPAGEIAHRLGFAAPEAFSRFIRRLTGTTPQDYRQQAVPEPIFGCSRLVTAHDL